MLDEHTTKMMQEAVNEMLVWVGFGTLVGLAAKAIMPGKDPGGAVSTLLMGIGGSVVGCGTLMFFWDGAKVTPISTFGFLAATGGAFILLFFYRLLSGSFFAESEDGERWLHRRRRRRRARRLVDETY
ncbi:GlsB/YeaQ/YmgE family stress response membrane protein [uncultured Gimesia sp.]|uniref:GlsB/YeaQ/YmgE family stress response membrane protein n=1 Tax=uncultured Gimesia sp. TaxID=1678688 RepID=UPI0026178703|nr:GlsB/YeaQ/YmgE family stress response membrane protein [uncultured Gimesia sp.]